jgi:hypothetical protein
MDRRIKGVKKLKLCSYPSNLGRYMYILCIYKHVAANAGKNSTMDFLVA